LTARHITGSIFRNTDLGVPLFDDIVRRAKRQARASIILSAGDSDDLREAAAILEEVADDCGDERLARSLTHMLDRLHRIIAAGEYRRQHFCSRKGKPKPFEYMTVVELEQEQQRITNELADLNKEIAELEAKKRAESGQ
jgi:phage shock protein A